MKIKNFIILFFLLGLTSLSSEDKFSSEDPFQFNLSLLNSENSKDHYTTLEKYYLKNNRLTYEWKYTGNNPNSNLPREIKRTRILKKTKSLQEFLEQSRLISDMRVSIFSKRLPQDNFSTECNFNIYHKSRWNHIYISGLKPIDDEKNREFDLILEFMEILRKELGLKEE